MSVTSTVAVVESAGNDVQLAFDFNFKIFSSSDLVVKKKTAAGVYTDPLILGVDYTVVFDSDAETGTVTYTTAPVSSGAAYIARSTGLVQNTVWPREGKVPAKTLENAVDKLTLLVQELAARIDGDIVVPAIGWQVGVFSALDANPGASSFIAKVTDLRLIMLFLGDRTLGNNGWMTLGGY